MLHLSYATGTVASTRYYNTMLECPPCQFIVVAGGLMQYRKFPERDSHVERTVCAADDDSLTVIENWVGSCKPRYDWLTVTELAERACAE